MEVTFEPDTMLATQALDVHAQLSDLEGRLSRGLAIIEDRRRTGAPYERHEDHWLSLLKEYEHLYDSLN
jgi:hypothetical protein